MLATTDKPAGFASRPSRTRTTDLSDAMAAVETKVSSLCAKLSVEQLSWSPGAGRWSISQNLAHLRTTTEIFLPAVDAALEMSRDLKLHSQGPFRLRLYGRLLVWQMDAKPYIKLRAPKPLRPQLLSSPALELEHFLFAQRCMRQRVDAAEGLDITALRFPSPLARYIRVNLLEFFSAFNAHSRRHVRQAENVRRKLPDVA